VGVPGNTLSVSLSGTGAGSIAGGEISCSAGVCSRVFVPGTIVTLTATPAQGSTFAGWSGACTGTGPCSVTMNSDQSITATFSPSVPGAGGTTGGGSTAGGSTAGGSTAGGSTGGGGTGGGSGGGGVLGSRTVVVSSAQVAVLLAGTLTPSGKGARITALLKSGGFAVVFKALEAGTAVIDWYQVPPGAKLAEEARSKPVLVAAGHLTFSGAGSATIKIKLTAAGKRLLKHAKKLKLTAKGTFAPTGKTPVAATTVFVLKR
jgi:uncharacterized repeat protein (TIGR02543 family)